MHRSIFFKLADEDDRLGGSINDLVRRHNRLVGFCLFNIFVGSTVLVFNILQPSSLWVVRAVTVASGLMLIALTVWAAWRESRRLLIIEEMVREIELVGASRMVAQMFSALVKEEKVGRG